MDYAEKDKPLEDYRRYKINIFFLYRPKIGWEKTTLVQIKNENHTSIVINNNETASRRNHEMHYDKELPMDLCNY